MADSPKVLIMLLQSAVTEYVQKERQRLTMEKMFLQNISDTELSPDSLAVDKFSYLFLVDEIIQFFGS